MATIPTYESQQTQVTPVKEVFVPSKISGIVNGFNKGLGDAKQVVDAVGKYEDVKEREQKIREQEDYELNKVAKNEQILNNSYSLYADNEGIRKQFANNPNPKLINKKLDEAYNKLIENPPSGLDKRSLDEWKMSMYRQYNNLRENNLRWGNAETAKLAKQSQQRLAEGILDLNLSEFAKAGYNGDAIKMDNLSLTKDGSIADDYVLPKTKEEKAFQTQGVMAYFEGRLDVPLEDPKNGIFMHLRSIDKSAELYDKKPREFGEEQVNKYFDDSISVIEDHPALDDTSKKYLISLAEARRKQKLEEFKARMDARSLELQKSIQREPNIQNLYDYLNSLAPQPDNMSFVEEPKPLFGQNYEYSPILGPNEDIAYRYSQAPIGSEASFDVKMLDMVRNARFPVGTHNIDTLYREYAPNGTIQEVQTLERFLAGSPNLTLTGERIDAMKPENGFDETKWAHQMLSDIAEMPDGTEDERVRKTAAANHALYQAQKEINGGRGFIDPSLSRYFEAALNGTAQNNYVSLMDDPSVMRMFASVAKNLSVKDLSPEQLKAQNSIINKGLSDMADAWNESQDKNGVKNGLKQIQKRVLQNKFGHILDIEDMEEKLQNGKPAYFTYHTVPHKYLGFTEDTIVAEVGGVKVKLGM